MSVIRPDSLGLRRSLLSQGDADSQAVQDELDQQEADLRYKGLTEPGKALRQGTLGLRSTLAAAQAIPDLIVGDQTEASQDLGEAGALQQRAARYQPRVSRLEDVNSPQDAAELLVNTLASQVPNLALAVAGGGVGGGIARYGLRRAVGGAAGAATEGLAAEAAPALAGTVEAQAVKSGAAKGVTAAVYPQLAGENLQSAEGTPDRRKAIASALVAAPQAALEELLPMRVLKNLGLTKTAEQVVRRAAGPKLLARIAEETGKGALTEGTTELAQQALQRGMRSFLSDHVHLMDDSAKSEYLNSFVLGGLGGGGFGGISAGVGNYLGPRGTVSDRYEKALADQEGADKGLVAREHRDETTPEEIQNIFDGYLREDSSIRKDPRYAKMLAEHINSPARRTPDDIALLQDLLRDQVRPEFADKVELLANALQVPSLAAQNEHDAENQDQAETDFSESDHPNALPTKEPADLEIYNGERLVEDDNGDKHYTPTPLAEQLFLTPEGTQAVHGEAAKEFKTNSFTTAKEKAAIEYARREGKDSVDEVAARINGVKGSELARLHAERTGRDVNEIALEAVEAKLKKSPKIENLIKRDDEGNITNALEVLDHYSGVTIEPSALDTAPGYKPEKLAKLFFRPNPKNPPRRGQINFNYRGKPVSLDIKELAFAEQKNRELVRGDKRRSQFLLRVADVVAEAFSTLVQTPGVEIDLNAIPNDLIVYARKGGKQITWGQLKEGVKVLDVHLDTAPGLRDARRKLAIAQEQGTIDTGLSEEETKQLEEAAAGVPGYELPAETEVKQGEGIESQLPRTKMQPRTQPTEVGAKTTVEPLLSQQHEQPEETIDRREGTPEAPAAEDTVEVSKRATEPREPTRRPVRVIRETPDVKAQERSKFARFVGEVLGKIPGFITPEGVEHAKTVGVVKESRDNESHLTTEQQNELTDLHNEIAEIHYDAYLAGGGDGNFYSETAKKELAALQAKLKALEKKYGVVPPARESTDVSSGEKKQASANFIKKLRTYMNAISKQFGLPKIKLITDRNEAIKHLESGLDSLEGKALRDQMLALARLRAGKSGGYQLAFTDGSIGIWVEPNMDPERVVQVLQHELGHVVAKSVSVSKEEATAIRDAFNKWLEGRGKEPLTRKNVSASKKPASLQSLSEKILEGEDATYALDFEEWFADNVSRWLSENSKPVTVLEKYFKKVAQQLKKLATALMKASGIDVSADKAVADLLESMWDKTEQIKQAEVDVHVNGAENDEAVGGKPLREWAQDNFGGLAASTVAAAHMSPGSPQANVLTHQIVQEELTESERKILGRVFGSGAIRRRLLDLVPPGVKTAIQRDVENTTNLLIAYGYQFWRTGQLQLGPQGSAVMEGIQSQIARMFGTVTRHKQAEEILIAAQQGVTKAQKAAGSVFDVERNRGKVWQGHARKVVQGTVDVTNRLMTPITTVMTRLYDSGNPTLIALGNRFAFRVGEQGQAENFVEAKTRRVVEFGKKLVDAYKGLTQQQTDELVEHLQNPSKLPSQDRAVNTALTKIRGVLEDMRTYATSEERGGKDFMGKIKDYFPWVFDLEQLQGRRQEFIDLLSQEKYQADLKELGTTAEKLYDGMIENYGYADVAVKGPVPFARHINERTLNFIYEKGSAADKEKLASFFNKHIDQTLAIYVDQVVKRAEFAGILGKKGEKLDAILAQAKKEGATEKQLEQARQFVAAMMGSYGAAEFHPVIKDTLKLADRWFGTKWAEMRPQELRKLQGLMIVYQNLRLLAFSVLSTLPDIAGLLLRGDMTSAFEGFRTGIREAVNLAKGNKSAAIELGETIGAIESHAIQELLMQAYGSTYLTPFARKLNDAFFKATGVVYMTKLSRLMAMAAGKRFIINQVKKPTKHSPRFLSELNLEPSDVAVDENGELVINDKVVAALNRYIDQTIIRPNASQRPLWGSHPDFAILFHLKQFMFSAEEVILRRMANEVAEGNISPVVTAMVGYITIGILSDLVREELKYDEEDPRKKNWDISAYIHSGARRAGLYGVGELLLDMQTERLYGGTGVKALAGPSYAQASELMDALVFGDRKVMKEALDAVPAANLLLEHRIFDNRKQEDDDGEAETERQEAA